MLKWNIGLTLYKPLAIFVFFGLMSLPGLTWESIAMSVVASVRPIY